MWIVTKETSIPRAGRQNDKFNNGINIYFCAKVSSKYIQIGATNSRFNTNSTLILVDRWQ